MLLQFDIQSHHIPSVRRSEPSFVSSSVFGAIIFPLFWHSESHLQLGVQSRLFLVQHSEPSYLLQFGLQSHIFSLVFRVVFLVWHSELLFVFSSTFRVIMSFFHLEFRTAFSVRRSKPYFQFSFQSRCLFQGWHSKLSYLLQFGIQSRIFSLVFRVVVYFQFSIQSHHVFFPFGIQSRVFSLAFRATSSVIIFPPFWHSKSLFVSSSAFITIISLVWHSEPLFFQFWHSQPHYLVWRSEPHLQFGIQSHCLFLNQHSEPPYSFYSAFRVVFQFGVQSRRLFLVRHSEPSYLFPFGIQSRIFSYAFKVVVYFQFDIQSHHISFSLAFKAIFSVWHSKLYFQFGIQNYCLFLVRHSESLCLSSVWHSKQHFQFGIQSRIFSLDFKVIVCFQVGIQSHHISFNLAFRDASLVWCSESLFVSSLAFKVIMSFFHLAFRVVSSVWHSELRLQFGIQSCVFSLAFRVASSVIIFRPFQRSELLFVSSLAFRAIISLVWHSEPLFFQLQRS